MNRKMAERLKEAMARKGLTVSKLAIRSGITERMIRYYISGHSDPGRYSLERMCGALDVSADWLVGTENKEEETHD